MKTIDEKRIEIRNEIQNKAVKLLYNFRRILLSWATGCGKSLAAIKMIEELFKHKSDLKGYVICKEKGHLNNFKEDIKLHKKEFINDISEMFLYASLHKYEDKGPVDFIILDEAHALTDNRMGKLKGMIDENTVVIYLTATLPYKLISKIKFHLGNYYEYHISIDDAIEKELLPLPNVYIHYYKPSNSLKTSIELVRGKNAIKQSVSYQKALTIINRKSFNLDVICTHAQAYELMTLDVNYWRDRYEDNQESWMKIQWVNKGSLRKKAMAHFKTPYAKELIKNEIKGFRYIIFTGSIIQCESIAGKTGNTIHSGKVTKRIMKIKDNFNLGKTDNLHVVNMFRESMNLKNVEKGLITQLDSVKLTFIQMLGRVFRSKIPEMHVMVFKDTQDEVYLKNALRDFNMKYVTEIYY